MLSLAIDKINSKNLQFAKFDKTTITDLEHFLSQTFKTKHLEYLGHGGMCICFFDKIMKQVIKCCKRNKRSIVDVNEDFIQWIQTFQKHNLCILYPQQVLYTDNNWIVYSQPLCGQINSNQLSYKVFGDILKFVKQMLQANLQFTDLYFRNFGYIAPHKLVLFDFHEVEVINITESDGKFTFNEFLLNNLYSTLVLVTKQLSIHSSLRLGPHLHYKTDSKDKNVIGQYNFPDVFITLFDKLSNHTCYMNEIQTLLNESIDFCVKQNDCLQLKLIKQLNSQNSQNSQELKFFICENLNLNLNLNSGHKILIYDNIPLAMEINELYPCLKIDTSIPQNYINSSYHQQLLQYYNTKAWINSDILVLQLNVIQHIQPKFNCYDAIVITSSTILSLLSSGLTMSVILNHLRQICTGKLIIDVPIVGDIRLYHQLKTVPTKFISNFTCLATIDSFRYQLIQSGLTVMSCAKLHSDKTPTLLTFVVMV